MNNLALKYFISVEYFCYILAVTIFLISILKSIKPIYYYFVGIRPKQEIIKTRLLFGYVFTYCLSLILIGHIIKLIYTGSFYVVGLVIFLIISLEGLTIFLDWEVQQLERKILKN